MYLHAGDVFVAERKGTVSGPCRMELRSCGAAGPRCFCLSGH